MLKTQPIKAEAVQSMIIILMFFALMSTIVWAVSQQETHRIQLATERGLREDAELRHKQDLQLESYWYPKDSGDVGVFVSDAHCQTRVCISVRGVRTCSVHGPYVPTEKGEVKR